jgi:hypothetical protein
VREQPDRHKKKSTHNKIKMATNTIAYRHPCLN